MRKRLISEGKRGPHDASWGGKHLPCRSLQGGGQNDAGSDFRSASEDRGNECPSYKQGLRIGRRPTCFVKKKWDQKEKSARGLRVLPKIDLDDIGNK